ncbi:hypothetical protein NARC_90158 [Candidatus Nitrosocosmicus arcticus]|uniref:Uncharacterized protein n=2 Tax=Candidatus Nitrosocosmicus arcticus TaxID=2035267 RepID=A0A557SUI1_9ARCH|nr:hypothetical protein NARC_90158 [Candidatus Nitrosocosmicus arcticus]
MSMGQNNRRWHHVLVWVLGKNVVTRTIDKDDGAFDAINAAIELRNSFQNLKYKMISDRKIDGINLDFNIKCGIITSPA